MSSIRSFRIRCLNGRRCDFSASLVALACAFSALAGATGSPAPPALFPQSVANALRAGALPTDAIGIAVLHARTGEVTLDVEATQPRQPASTLKTLTSIVALDTARPDARFGTQWLADGALDGDRLAGHLYLRGKGNPDFDAQQLEQSMRALRVAGVRRIAGDIVLDRSFYRPHNEYLLAPAFDETPEFRYNVVPDALMLGSNLLRLTLASDARGVTVAASPALDDVEVVPRFALNAKRCADWEDDWQYPEVAHKGGRIVVALRGGFPRDCTVVTEINVLDRSDYAARLLASTWRRLGGEWAGRVREGETPPGARVLAEQRSRTLAELTRDINKRSDNPITRMVFLNVAARDDGTGTLRATAAQSSALVQRWLDARQIARDGLFMENGSGLSRRERISPLTLARTLVAAQASPWFAEFLSTFPIVGVDGAMRQRLADTPVAQQGRIKTGSLRDVASVAGYVSDARGERYVVVAMINHPEASGKRARPVLDAVLDWVGRTDLASWRRNQSARGGEWRGEPDAGR
ncbi:MAG: D-alanyl-D-alanine carboxypeptidase/D-alanyl-D-alanine-endopeptidase [Burkholderiales bacterium]|nr:D-alanyl-D-alanine carboxypeptidase/D-alanyl-D-alanine-endopeptidase [Burkholderiales bacterium]